MFISETLEYVSAWLNYQHKFIYIYIYIYSPCYASGQQNEANLRQLNMDNIIDISFQNTALTFSESPWADSQNKQHGALILL